MDSHHNWQKRKIFGISEGSILFILVLLLALVTVISFSGKSGMTGFFVYPGDVREYSFDDLSSGIYNASAVDVSDNEIKLREIIEYTEWTEDKTIVYDVTKAYYNPKDKTSNLISKDNENHEVEEGELLNVFFEESLDNGDNITLYLLNSNEGKIKICDLYSECNEAQYGSTEFSGDEGWLNITLSGLDSPKNEFTLMTTADIKFDYISAYNGNTIMLGSALYNPSDKTSTVVSVGDGSVTINEKIFDIGFDTEITNDDILSFYIKDSHISDVILCEKSTLCDDGYGSFEYNGSTGWFNKTVYSENPLDFISLRTYHGVEFDYIILIRPSVIIHTNTASYYSIEENFETYDFESSNVYAWNSIVADEELNGQSVEYYYSTDSGAAWIPVIDGDISSADASAGKIRIKVVLIGNGSATPSVSNISLTYFGKMTCNPDWHPDNNSCISNDLRLISYTDTNNCNSSENISFDNGTYASCDYCTPIWIEINSSCTPDNNLTAWYNDSKACFTLTELASDNDVPLNQTYACEYVNDNITNNMTENETNQTNPTGSVFRLKIINDEMMTEIGLEATVNLTDDNVSLSNTTINASTELTPVRNVDIEVNDSIKENMLSSSLRFYYNDTILSEQGINESTLAVFYFNETSGQLEEIPSTINLTGKYVEANMTHFSKYGLYGVIIEGSGSSASSTSDNSRGSSSENPIQYSPITQSQAAVEEKKGVSFLTEEDAQGSTKETQFSGLYGAEENGNGTDAELTGQKRPLNMSAYDSKIMIFAFVILLIVISSYIFFEIKASKRE